MKKNKNEKDIRQFLNLHTLLIYSSHEKPVIQIDTKA